MLDNSEITCWGDGNNGRLGNSITTDEYEVPITYSGRAAIGTSSTSHTEQQPMKWGVRGSAFDDVNLDHVQFDVELPPGLVFSPSNQTIFGVPHYTTKTDWNFSILNGTSEHSTTFQLQILADTDRDGLPNTVDTDDDGDGYGDPVDACPTLIGNSTIDQLGCPDNDGMASQMMATLFQ